VPKALFVAGLWVAMPNLFIMNGIRVSLAEYGVEASYNDYVNDNTRMAQDYVDPYNSDLNIAAMNNVTVKFGGDQ
jgi:hypothetical protein